MEKYYKYYINTRTRNLAYYFSDREYTKKDAESRKRGQWFSAVVFIFFGLISLITYALSRNDKITTDYDTAIVIQDDAQVLSGDDQSGLERSFAGFLEKTGITPAFCLWIIKTGLIDIPAWNNMPMKPTWTGSKTKSTGLSYILRTEKVTVGTGTA